MINKIREWLFGKPEEKKVTKEEVTIKSSEKTIFGRKVLVDQDGNFKKFID